MTDPLPGRYVFDVVDNNSAALEKASRTTYRSVWVAEERGSALDGRLAADILRAVRGQRKGLFVTPPVQTPPTDNPSAIYILNYYCACVFVFVRPYEGALMKGWCHQEVGIYGDICFARLVFAESIRRYDI